MKTYFYADGTIQKGPFTLEELKEKGITRETLVWFHGLADWKPAGTIPELSELFDVTPPIKATVNEEMLPIEPAKNDFAPPIMPACCNDGEKPRMPKPWLTEAILVTVLCCAPFGIPAIIHAAKVEFRYRNGNYEGAKASSKVAKKWVTIGFILGLALVLFYILYFVAVLAMLLPMP